MNSTCVNPAGLSTCRCQVRAQTKTSSTAVESAAAPVINVTGVGNGDIDTTTGQEPSTVHVQIQCRSLGRTGDMVSALCIVLRRNRASKVAVDWIEVGQTELQYAQTSPSFSTIFDIDITPDVTSELKVHATTDVHFMNLSQGCIEGFVVEDLSISTHHSLRMHISLLCRRISCPKRCRFTCIAWSQPNAFCSSRWHMGQVEVHIVNSIKGSVSKPVRDSSILGIGDLEPQFYGVCGAVCAVSMQ